MNNLLVKTAPVAEWLLPILTELDAEGISCGFNNLFAVLFLE